MDIEEFSTKIRAETRQINQLTRQRASERMEATVCLFVHTIGKLPFLVAVKLLGLLTLPIGVIVYNLLAVLTFGLTKNLVWRLALPFDWALLGTSWLWIKIPPSRGVLILPGWILLVMAGVAYGLFLTGEEDQGIERASLTVTWPASWYFRFPQSQD